MRKKGYEDLRDQKMPRKLQELLDSNQRAANAPKYKKKVKTPGLLTINLNSEGDDKGCTRALKVLPEKVEQGPYESEEQFLNRLQRMATKAKAEACIEDKYDVDFAPKILSTVDGKAKNENRGKEKDPVSKKLAKRKARDEKRKNRKRKKPSHDEYKPQVDKISFGEVAMAPPTLPQIKRRKPAP